MNPIRAVVTVASVLLVTGLSIAQITITQDSMPGFGSVQSWYLPDTDPALNVGPGGANQSWNVPETQVALGGSSEIVNPAGTPFAGSFPTATHCFADGGDFYTYARIAASGFHILGLAAPGFMQVWDPESTRFPFPTTYNTSWTSVSSWGFELPGESYATTDSSVNTVDGWGTMTTQFGSYQVLRVASHAFRITTVTIPPSPPHVNTTTNYSYQWLTASGMAAVLMTSNADETDPNFTEGNITFVAAGTEAIDETRGPVANNFSVGQNYPNPFNPTTTLPITIDQATKAEVIVYNELGEVVMHEQHNFGPGTHAVPFDGSAWASGSYFANVRADGVSQTKRMTLVK